MILKRMYHTWVTWLPPPPCVLKVATGLKDEWEATTVAIPEGVLCFETDTQSSKVGNGTDLYASLDYVFDAIPSAIRDLVDNSSLIALNSDGIIDTSYFPKEVFNIHIVVATIEARDALSLDIIKNSQMVFVIDATDDPSVTAGFALYVARFTDDTTYEWIKTGEGESLDLDFSQYLLTESTTLDDINDSDTYKRLEPSDINTLEDALQASDIYTINLEDHLY